MPRKSTSPASQPKSASKPKPKSTPSATKKKSSGSSQANPTPKKPRASKSAPAQDSPKPSSYGNESISMLKGPDRVRKRPAVIFGSDGLEGCEHAVFEILSNSIDEAREGHGDLITVTRYLDKSVQVDDEGRGIPVEFNKNEDEYNWQLIFCEMYAGGKYDNNNAGNYSFSLGLNGLGACATQYSSEFMDVVIHRDRHEYTLHFEKGYNRTGPERGFTRKKYDGVDTGTSIRWKPDLDVFTDIDIPLSYFQDILRRQAIVNAGIRFVLRDETDPGKFAEETYCYERGIEEYLESIVGDNALSSVQVISGERRGRDREDKEPYDLKISVAFCFHKSLSFIEYYHNSSWLEHGGSPDKAVRAAFLSAIDQYLRQTGKYNKNESKISVQDVLDSLMLISNCFSTYTSYENQTKKSITNRFVQEAMTELLKNGLQAYFAENKTEADRIAAQVLVNKRSRAQAEKSRVNIKKKLSGSIDISNRVQKFVDCRSRDVSRRELYIVEGDSALGSVKLSRNAEFQAIMPIRGKILNCLKADYPRIFKSEIITDLMKVIGCGVEVPNRKSKDLNSFDITNLRWNKIIICTDADVDGFQIRTLLLTMLYRLTPTLIQEGYVYIAETPLYEISYKDKGRDMTWFAYSDREKSEILAGELAGKKCSIQRSKGLGENDPGMMALTTMNPATRRLIRVMPDDAGRTAEVFDLLLGDNLQGRKEHIAECGAKYLDELDVS